MNSRLLARAFFTGALPILLALVATGWAALERASVDPTIAAGFEGASFPPVWYFPLAVFAIAGVAGAAAVAGGRLRAVRFLALGCGAVLAALSLVALGRLAGDIRGEWPSRADRSAIVAAVPPDASVSAPLRFLSHLSARRDLYTFPVPFVESVPESEWSPAQVAAARERVEYVVFDPTLTRNPEALEDVLRLGFAPVLTRGTTTLLRAPSATR